MGQFSDLFSKLDADDRIKGKQFEHICKWFLTNDPVYKHELRRVWLWDEWSGPASPHCLLDPNTSMAKPPECDDDHVRYLPEE